MTRNSCSAGHSTANLRQADALSEEQVSEYKEAFSLFVSL